MTPANPFPIARVAALCLALTTAWSAHAQGTGTPGATGAGMSSSFGSDGYSVLPYTRSGYVGLNLGKPNWRTDCAPGFNCDDGNVSVYLYTGGLINDVLGVELGYVNTGSADRNGGSVRGQGVNLSLVARVPLGPFNVFAKAGGLYGQTRVSADMASGMATGTERGWGGAYAAGAGYDITPQSGVVLEWARNEFRFPGGGGRQAVDSVSLGLVRRF